MDNDSAKMPARQLLVIGWLELVDLPDLGLHDLKTKIDTGARTSALHAEDIQLFTKATDDKGTQGWVRFRTVPVQGDVGEWHEWPVHDLRNIKNTGGMVEERIVIRTRLKIAGRLWKIDVSLTDRSDMNFALIIGRTALKNHSIAVDTRRKYLTRARPA